MPKRSLPILQDKLQNEILKFHNACLYMSVNLSIFEILIHDLWSLISSHRSFLVERPPASRSALPAAHVFGARGIRFILIGQFQLCNLIMHCMLRKTSKNTGKSSLGSSKTGRGLLIGIKFRPEIGQMAPQTLGARSCSLQTFQMTKALLFSYTYFCFCQKCEKSY